MGPIEIKDRIDAALQTADPLAELERLVYALSDVGMDRETIYQAFLLYHNENMYSAAWLSDENKNNGDHPVDLTLDRICGWCSKDYEFKI